MLHPYGKAIFLLTLLSLPACTCQAEGVELSGFIAAETRLFQDTPLFAGQKNNESSIAIQPELYHRRDNGDSIILIPFARLDSSDPQRTHADIREFNYVRLYDTWELRFGIGKVFWGATEFVHLIDIINQTDAVEAVDGEDKLGQPMVHFSMPRDTSAIDFFILPYFRERTFPGRKGRLRSGLVIDTDMARYESGAEEQHLDFAVRYNGLLEDSNFGIYHFSGTGREPTLDVGLNGSRQPVFIPLYTQINQTGLDMQRAAGEWLWKLEALHRTGLGKSFFALTGGLEYTFYDVAETGLDLGVIAEGAYDDRRDQATTSFENDIMLGLRLTANDAASTELLTGISQDLDSQTRILSFEASRRFSESIKGSLKGGAFLDAPEDDLLYSLRHDNFIHLRLAYYF